MTSPATQIAGAFARGLGSDWSVEAIKARCLEQLRTGGMRFTGAHVGTGGPVHVHHQHLKDEPR